MSLSQWMRCAAGCGNAVLCISDKADRHCLGAMRRCCFVKGHTVHPEVLLHCRGVLRCCASFLGRRSQERCAMELDSSER